jgi:hypothetical protein
MERIHAHIAHFADPVHAYETLATIRTELTLPGLKSVGFLLLPGVAGCRQAFSESVCPTASCQKKERPVAWFLQGAGTIS